MLTPVVCLLAFLQVRAASDLKALARLIPTEARLVLDPGAAPEAAPAGAAGNSGSSSVVEYALVQTSSVRPGDILRVLPGETLMAP
jgi:Cu2+-exporting ATPase